MVFLTAPAGHWVGGLALSTAARAGPTPMVAINFSFKIPNILGTAVKRCGMSVYSLRTTLLVRLCSALALTALALGLGLAEFLLRRSVDSADIYRIVALGVAAFVLLGIVLATWLYQLLIQRFADVFQGSVRIGSGVPQPVVAAHLEYEFAAVQEAVIANQRAVSQASMRLAEDELSKAAYSQLLQLKPMHSDSFDLVFKSHSSGKTKGDWVQRHLVDERFLYLLAGDITGQGASPALVSAMVSGAFEMMKLDMDAGRKMPAVGTHGSTLARSGAVLGTADILKAMNAVMLGIGGGEYPISLLAILLDLETGMIEYASAGYPSPRLVRLGAIEPQRPDRVNYVKTLRGRTDLLGFAEQIKPEVRTLKLIPGDLIVVHSDGLSERRNAAGHAYGSRRLDSFLGRYEAGKAERLARALVEDSIGYGKGSAIVDDVSVMVLHFKALSKSSDAPARAELKVVSS